MPNLKISSLYTEGHGFSIKRFSFYFISNCGWWKTSIPMNIITLWVGWLPLFHLSKHFHSVFIPFIRSFVWRVAASHIVTFIPNTRCRTNVILCTISVFRCKCWKHLYMVSFRFFLFVCVFYPFCAFSSCLLLFAFHFIWWCLVSVSFRISNFFFFRNKQKM